NRGAAPAGSVRVYGSQGWARSSDTPMPYWNRPLIMIAKVTIDAVAYVAATGSPPANGTTKNTIEAVGKNTAPMTATGMRIVSRSWYLVWVNARFMLDSRL